jgi:hypothetical protein
MNSRKARRTWFHLGCSIVLFALLAASAVAEEPIDRRLAAGPDFGTPGGAIAPARPGSLNAVPDPRLRPPLTKAAPAVPETVLATKGFTFAASSGATDTEVVQFPVPGPGKVILEASNTGTPLAKLGLIARAPKPPGQSPVDTRWDGPTPLRAEFPVTTQDLANLGTKGNVWTVFITLRDLPPPRGTGGRYAIPGLAVVGSLKVSFVADAPARKTALEPKTVPNLGATAQPTSGTATGKSGPAQATPGTATGKAVPPAEPKWPQPFELGAGESTSTGFVAGKPGPIVVTVQWTGVPLTVSLVKPGGGTVDQQGKGSVTLRYTATADDVKKGMLWGVGIRPAQEAPKPAAGPGIAAIDKPVRIDTTGVAKGTVTVQHPPGDMKLAQAEWNARAGKAQALQPKSPPAATAIADILAQKNVAQQKQQTARQATLLEQVRSKIPVQAYQQVSRKIALGENPKVPGAVAATPGNPSGFTARAGAGGDVILAWSPVPNAIHYILQGPGVPPWSSSPNITGTTYTVKGLPAGTNSWSLWAVYKDPSGQPYWGDENNPARISLTVSSTHLSRPSSPPAPPVIASLSVSSGKPGTPVLLEGSGFSLDPGGEVYLNIGGKDYIMSTNLPDGSTGWFSDSKIMATVPDALRVFGNVFLIGPGKVYVKLGSGVQSNRVPFEFIPSTQFEVFPLTEKQVRFHKGDGADDFWNYASDPRQVMAYHKSTLMFGHKGDDFFLENYRLKNGWVLDSVVFWKDPVNWSNGSHAIAGSLNQPAGASIVEAAYGTDAPAVKIHWWNNGYGGVYYTVGIIIRGPWGVPFQ